jgi:hypothetical protein
MGEAPVTSRVILFALLAGGILPAEALAQRADANKNKKKDKDGRAGETDAKGTPDRLQFGGRVYVRDQLSGVDVDGDTIWLHRRSLDTARAFITFRPNRRTRMDLEVDFAGDQAELKDTFIRYQPIDYLELTAGRFKRPVSFLSLESTWDLPRIDRGLLSELRLDGRRLLFAGGRSEGIAVDIEVAADPRLDFSLVVHESDLADDLGLEVSDAMQDVFGRVEIEPVSDLHLAVAAGWVGSLHDTSNLASYRHRPFATLELFLESQRLRAWLEGMAGLNSTTYVDGRQIGRFVAAQALVAPRFENQGWWGRAWEPYAAAAWYEPSTLQPADQIGELTGGVTLWISGKLRLQLEAGRRLAQESAAIAESTLVRVQFGAAFRSETTVE